MFHGLFDYKIEMNVLPERSLYVLLSSQGAVGWANRALITFYTLDALWSNPGGRQINLIKIEK